MNKNEERPHTPPVKLPQVFHDGASKWLPQRNLSVTRPEMFYGHRTAKSRLDHFLMFNYSNLLRTSKTAASRYHFLYLLVTTQSALTFPRHF
ncbi:hypothetical protein CDAR_105341 [Caerostris darwini]|uniref:Uncharacterized protein n=1 Tax=Caerostris darwini TaxID=1538125 RepID=A0AAV4SGF8_9ARAC|nr:hypothetical protein CDAR_105341 [Caerostris darwini]